MKLSPRTLFLLLLAWSPLACGGGSSDDGPPSFEDDGEEEVVEQSSGGDDKPAANSGATGSTASSSGSATEVDVLDPSTYGSVHGVVRFDGTPPAQESVTTSLVECHEHGGESIEKEDYVINDGKIANVYVYIRRGLSRDLEFEPKTEPVNMDQKGCRFIPHAVALQAGQPLNILNSDPGLHNAKLIGKLNDTLNVGLPEGQSKSVTLKRGNEIIKVDCDVHPFMRAYVGVFKHPFFAVTGSDGSFHIDDLPPGDYTLQAWHEKLGTIDEKFTLEAKGSSEINFRFSG